MGGLIGCQRKVVSQPTAQVNNQIVNFLDITLDLENAKFAPYRKPNNQPLYVDSRSNHPPSILKQIPISINKRTLPFHLTKNPSMNANLSMKAHLNTAITMFLWNIQPTALLLHHLRNSLSCSATYFSVSCFYGLFPRYFNLFDM